MHVVEKRIAVGDDAGYKEMVNADANNNEE